MTAASTTDRIEKEIRLSAPRSRVWRALTDSTEFAKWFGVEKLEPFVVGKAASGEIRFKGQAISFEVIVEAIEPEHHFAFWWRPYAIDPTYDYSGEPRTLVAFTLSDEGEETLLKVVESGFDGIPAARRTIAFDMDSAGWASQMKRIQNYLTANP
jgi:uncharacterized protein YndB with AHSA1/START domain